MKPPLLPQQLMHISLIGHDVKDPVTSLAESVYAEAVEISEPPSDLGVELVDSIRIKKWYAGVWGNKASQKLLNR